MDISQNGRRPHITILGGGLGGLAVGYYASKKGLPFVLYEASDRVGGNCTTLKHGDFLFDSGAHRFHDRDRRITKEVKELLGADLKTVDIPSKIYYRGKLMTFPLAPLDLARNLGLCTLVRVGLEILRGRLVRAEQDGSFESFAINTYGKTIAEQFLLNYSEKLWGQSCDKLSRAIAGERLQGLNVRTFLIDSILPKKSRTRHLEGMFYYPKFGISAISEKLAERCGRSNIRTDSRVTGIAHNSRRIGAVEVNGKEWVDTDEVVSTLPLGYFLGAMRPAAPQRLLDMAERLRYRSLILVSLFINRSLVTRAATVYFPDRSFPFTRLYEPKNRCEHMSPAEQTSLVAEIPCQREDGTWARGDDELIEMVRSKLVDIGWITETEIMNASVRRLDYAYPILEVGAEPAVREIRAYLESFANLTLSGRNGRFVYSWIHDMMKFGREIIGQHCRKYRDAGPRILELKTPGGKGMSTQRDETRQMLSS